MNECDNNETNLTNNNTNLNKHDNNESNLNNDNTNLNKHDNNESKLNNDNTNLTDNLDDDLATCKLIIYFNTFKYKHYVGNNIVIPDFEESITNRVLDISTNDEKQLCCHIINENDCFQMLPLIDNCQIDFIIIDCFVSKFSKKGKKRKNSDDDFACNCFEKCLKIAI